MPAIRYVILHSVVQLFYGIYLVELSEVMQTLLISADLLRWSNFGQNKKRAILFVWTTVPQLKECYSCYRSYYISHSSAGQCSVDYLLSPPHYSIIGLCLERKGGTQYVVQDPA